MSVEDNLNFEGLPPQIISFEVVEIIPVSFLGAITRTDIKAFDRLSEQDFVCSVINNDGSIIVIDSSLVRVIYESGDSFRKSDSRVKLAYDKFTLSLPIEVGYADYDMSGVKWVNTEQVYSGEAKLPALSGLPAGVRVIEYMGDKVINAGSYKIYVKLEYDSENYNEPIVAPCDFTIQKCPVNIPLLTSVYNGSWQMAVSDSSLYIVDTKKEFRGAGSYVVTVSLTDSENYVFAENNRDRANAVFEILPAPISVKVSDVSLKLFEKLSGADYIITSGSIFDGDTLTVSVYSEGKSVLLRSENPNYILKVTPGRIKLLPYPTQDAGIVISLILALIIILVLLSLSVYKHRHRLSAAGAMLKCRWHNRNFKAAPPRDNPPFTMKYDLNSFATVSTEEVETDIEPSEREEEVLDDTEGEELEVDLEIDAEKADTLISDSLAKSLIKREGEMVFTNGSEKGIVNIDLLNKNFSSGDRVDINSLKEKGILGEEVAYYKVLAGGKINKALKVYANDFSLTAVKMIALTGGEAIKIVTFKDKSKDEKE